MENEETEQKIKEITSIIENALQVNTIQFALNTGVILGQNYNVDLLYQAFLRINLKFAEVNTWLN